MQVSQPFKFMLIVFVGAQGFAPHVYQLKENEGSKNDLCEKLRWLSNNERVLKRLQCACPIVSITALA